MTEVMEIFSADDRSLLGLLSVMESCEQYGYDKATVQFAKRQGFYQDLPIPRFSLETTMDDTVSDMDKFREEAKARIAAKLGGYQAKAESSHDELMRLSASITEETEKPKTRSKVPMAVIAAVLGAAATAVNVALSWTERIRATRREALAEKIKTAREEIAQAKKARDAAIERAAKTIKAKKNFAGKLEFAQYEVSSNIKNVVEKTTELSNKLLSRFKKPEIKEIIPTAWEASTPAKRIAAAGVMFAITTLVFYVINTMVLRAYRWVKEQLVAG